MTIVIDKNTDKIILKNEDRLGETSFPWVGNMGGAEILLTAIFNKLHEEIIDKNTFHHLGVILKVRDEDTEAIVGEW